MYSFIFIGCLLNIIVSVVIMIAAASMNEEVIKNEARIRDYSERWRITVQFLPTFCDTSRFWIRGPEGESDIGEKR